VTRVHAYINEQRGFQGSRRWRVAERREDRVQDTSSSGNPEKKPRQNYRAYYYACSPTDAAQRGIRRAILPMLELNSTEGLGYGGGRLTVVLSR
jgi:hypothetical protein